SAAERAGVIASGRISARSKNTRYAGALSRKADNTPASQNAMIGRTSPAAFRVNRNPGANGPARPWRNSSDTGSRAMKMPANNTGTSSIGCKEKSLARRIAGGVIHSENAPATTANSTGEAETVTLAAMIRTSATLPQPRSENFCTGGAGGSVRASQQSMA